MVVRNSQRATHDSACMSHPVGTYVSEEIFLKTSRRGSKERLGISMIVCPDTRFEVAHSLMSAAKDFGVMTGTIVVGTKKIGA